MNPFSQSPRAVYKLLETYQVCMILGFRLDKKFCEDMDLLFSSDIMTFSHSLYMKKNKNKK